LAKVADLARYPELMWLHKHELTPPIALAALCFIALGWPGLVVGFVWSTVLVYHATFCINSLAHMKGKARYVTGDDSRNNWLLAVVTMGEGWHNNHHAYQASARQGFKWWEYDPTFYLLKGLSWLGVVWDLKTPPERVLRNEQRVGWRVIDRAAGLLAAQFDSERIALAIAAARHGPDLAALKQSLARAGHQSIEVLTNLRLPEIPSRDDLLAKAKSMFAKTPSLEDIVDRANELLLAAIGARLVATNSLD